MWCRIFCWCFTMATIFILTKSSPAWVPLWPPGPRWDSPVWHCFEIWIWQKCGKIWIWNEIVKRFYMKDCGGEAGIGQGVGQVRHLWFSLKKKNTDDWKSVWVQPVMIGCLRAAAAHSRIAFLQNVIQHKIYTTQNIFTKQRYFQGNIKSTPEYWKSAAWLPGWGLPRLRLFPLQLNTTAVGEAAGILCTSLCYLSSAVFSM